jgi:prevent-host-death family protein
MTSVSITYAKVHLSEIVSRAAAGEVIEITRRGKPVAWLTAGVQPREPIKLALLRAMAAGRPPSTQDAENLIRSMRDHDRH